MVLRFGLVQTECLPITKVSCVIGYFSLNIFHAFLLSYPRNKSYWCTPNLAKNVVFFFLTGCWKVALVCLCTNPLSYFTLEVSPCIMTLLIIPTILCGSICSGCIVRCTGQGFVVALCNDFHTPSRKDPNLATIAYFTAIHVNCLPVKLVFSQASRVLGTFIRSTSILHLKS